METITLPSNASMDIFPKNTTTSFTVQLARPLEIPEGTEVGLAEVQYPHSWYSVPKNLGNIRLRHKNQNGIISIPMVYGMFESPEHFCKALTLVLKNTQIKLKTSERPVSKEIHISSQSDSIEPPTISKPADYASIGYSRSVWRYRPYDIADSPDSGFRLVKTAQDLQAFYTISFKFNSVHEKIVLIVGEGEVLELDPKISDFLGFDETSFLPGSPYIGDRVFDMNQGLHSLYVYCDLICPRYVGDTKAQLLRSVPEEGVKGERITKTFQKPFFFRCNTRKISKIQIDIKSELGECVPFETSPSEVTLQLRRIKPYEEF